MVVFAGIGAFTCKKQDKRVLSFVTSVIGGWGAAVGIRLAVGAQKEEFPSWAGILIVTCVGGIGFTIQLLIIRRRERNASRNAGATNGLSV